MTEEELIKDIVWKIQKYPYNPKFQKNAEEIAIEIVKTIREAGWNPLTCCDRCPHYPEVWKEKWDASEHYKD